MFMCTDLEGVSGVTSFEDEAYPTGKYYEKVRDLLTAEVNAAVEGLLQSDVTEVLVLDGHGAGGVLVENLHPAAKLLHGRPSAPMSEIREIMKGYDTAMMLGQHAMAGVQAGTLNHTQDSKLVDYYELNGVRIGEIAQFALQCGALGLPLICLTGDEAACEEFHQLIPLAVTVAVKKGITRSSAISLAPSRAREVIRDGVEKAVANHRAHPIEPLVWQGPYVLEKRFFTSTAADRYENLPNAERIDSLTVQIKGDDILDIIYA